MKSTLHADEDDGEPMLLDDETDLSGPRARHAAQWREVLRQQGIVLSHDFDPDN